MAVAEERILILRMGALGDIVHTLPAVAALRDQYPAAQIDWLVDRKWSPVLMGNTSLTRMLPVDRGDWREVISVVRALRAAGYTIALDFQSLYRTAILSRLSGTPRRIGFDSRYAREGAAAILYTETVLPKRLHKIEHNLELVERLAVQVKSVHYPMKIPTDAQERVDRLLASNGLRDYFVLSPGGGWNSKCWPAERYGALHRAIVDRYGWRGVISFGPGERGLAEIVRRECGEPAPLIEPLDLPELMAILCRAKFLVAADTGPLHLAVALGTPVIGLYGPTDPVRNGPFSTNDIVVRNAMSIETTYRRSKTWAPSMLSITVEQVLAAIAHRLKSCG
jgi:lipopolysaccharide heptosyltransferase I